MYPYLFNLEELPSYLVLICIGIFAAFVCFSILSTKAGLSNSAFRFYGICAIIAIIGGFLFARLFQMLYNFIETGDKGTGITFLGGLIGGIGVFFLIERIAGKKHRHELQSAVNIIIPCIVLAHFFGRIGCFLAGCCYGAKTDLFFGIRFVESISQNGEWIYGEPRIPTQLIEALFLLLLFITLLIFIFRFKKPNFTAIVYMYSYSIFRFFLEFLRDDPRGAFLLGLSPSQIICILLLVAAIILNILIIKKQKKLS